MAEPLRRRGGVRSFEISEFGTNPGALKMFTHVPERICRERRRLSSSCTAAARPRAAYDFGTGWSTLAKRYGFALLMPEQQRSNNANTCFNWFNPEDVARGQRRSRLDPPDDRADGRRSQASIPAASISPAFPPAAR